MLPSLLLACAPPDPVAPVVARPAAPEIHAPSPRVGEGGTLALTWEPGPEARQGTVTIAGPAGVVTCAWTASFETPPLCDDEPDHPCGPRGAPTSGLALVALPSCRPAPASWYPAPGTYHLAAEADGLAFPEVTVTVVDRAQAPASGPATGPEVVTLHFGGAPTRRSDWVELVGARRTGGTLEVRAGGRLLRCPVPADPDDSRAPMISAPRCRPSAESLFGTEGPATLTLERDGLPTLVFEVDVSTD